MPKKSKVQPAISTRGQLSKLSKIQIQGNKQVPIVLRAIFSNYDADASGSISKKEMAALVMDLQSLLPGTPAHLKHCANVVSKIAMAALDIDGGGTIDEDEFVEWCQGNLFLTSEDRATMLVSNMDLSQFVTALEMCVKMQLAGIGPYNYYTPPPPSCKEKWCTKKLLCLYCCIFFIIFIVSCICFFFLVAVPLECWGMCPAKAKSRTKKKSSTAAAATGASTGPAPSGTGAMSDGTAPAAARRFLIGGLRPPTLLEQVESMPTHMKWDHHWNSWSTGKVKRGATTLALWWNGQ